MSLMIAASDRRDKMGAAVIAMGITYLLAALPNRSGLLLAVVISVALMMFVQRLRRP